MIISSTTITNAIYCVFYKMLDDYDDEDINIPMLRRMAEKIQIIAASESIVAKDY